MKNQINFKHQFLKNWVLLFLLFLIVLFSILEPSFFSLRNFNNILIASTAILLLAAGETRIFAFTPCFRNREQGLLHAIEFTMLEWYRAGEPYEAVMEDAAHLLRLACRTTGQRLVSWRGGTADPMGAAEHVRVAEAFACFAGIDLLATVGDDGAPDREALAAQVRAQGITVRDGDSWSPAADPRNRGESRVIE